MDFNKSIQLAKDYLGNRYFKDLSITFKNANNPNYLRVEKDKNIVLITYGHLSLLFRGLTLLKEKHDVDCFKDEIHQCFTTSGAMVDCSRNGVLRNEKIKELILISALMGHNRFLIYSEDIFKMEEYPYFGYLRGAYSKEDIKSFVEYGLSFGIELVPCIQTLGHFRQALKWLPMDHLRDGAETLLIDSPEVYKFIEDIIKYCRECFNSKNIHIGMDESFEIGLHRHLRQFGYQDRVEMFSRHLSKVRQICNKYNFEPMIWSDMYFRLNSFNQDYYIDKPLPESTLSLIPEGVKLVYWDYYHERKEDYKKMINFHKQTSNPIVFAGGSWRWVGFAPLIKYSVEYTKCALEACKEENIKDIFMTAWGDDGNEAAFFNIIPVLSTSSVMNGGEYDINKIDSLVKAISDDSINDFFALDLPNRLMNKKTVFYYNPSKYLFYQDILLGMFDGQVKKDFPIKYEQYTKLLNEKAKNSTRYSYMYKTLADLCDVLTIKCDLGIRIRKAYKDNNLIILQSLLDDVDNLIIKVDEFHTSFEKQWMIECRAFGYDVIDGRFGFLKNRILTAKERIKDYLDKKISSIEELEEDILPFDGREDELSWNWWYRNVSPSH